MSPKMSFCDKTPATECDAAEGVEELEAAPHDEGSRSPLPHEGLRALFAQIRTKWQAAESKPAA